MIEANDIRVELPDFGVIAVGGAEARSFLGNLLTADVRTVSGTVGVFTAWCDAKGRALATLWLVQRGDVFYLVLPAERIQSVLSGLTRYRLRSKVTLEDVSSGVAVTGLSGDPARLATALGTKWPATVYGCQDAAQGLVLSIPASGEPRGLYLGDLPAMPTVHAEKPAFWDWQDVMAGIPWITGATVGEFIPQMLNLGRLGGLCFTKGCYPGQEVIARLHYRGQLKRQMFLATLETGSGIPLPGTPLYGEGLSESLGVVVQAAPDPAGTVKLLAVVKRDDKDRSPVHAGQPAGPLVWFS